MSVGAALSRIWIATAFKHAPSLELASRARERRELGSLLALGVSACFRRSGFGGSSGGRRWLGPKHELASSAFWRRCCRCGILGACANCSPTRRASSSHGRRHHHRFAILRAGRCGINVSPQCETKKQADAAQIHERLARTRRFAVPMNGVNFGGSGSVGTAAAELRTRKRAASISVRVQPTN